MLRCREGAQMARQGLEALMIRRMSVISGHVASSSPSPDLPSSAGGLWRTPASRNGPASRDGSATGDEDHGWRAKATAWGAVAGSAAAFYTSSSTDHVAHSKAAPPPALNPKEFLPFSLKEVHVLNHNTKIYRFKLEPGQKLGLTVASCLVTRAPVGSLDDSGRRKNVIRPYTPVTQPDVEGYFDLLVKVYPNGTMSKHIDSLKPGDKLEIKGPIPKLPYTPNVKRSIGMVAGGTGITPMLQVIDAVLSNPGDNTQLSLVFANASPADVLLKTLLEDYATRHPNFKVHFLVDKADPQKDGWKGGIGYVTSDVLKKALPPPGDDSLVLVCGPPGMMRLISGDKAPDKSQGELEGLLKELGYTKDQVYKF